MKAKIITILGFGLFVVTACFAGPRSANAYKTHKLTTNSVMISCEDEREPVVKHWENTTLIVVTCQTVTARPELDKKLDNLPALPQ